MVSAGENETERTISLFHLERCTAEMVHSAVCHDLG
jgi:hypothetical protein